MTRKLSLLTVIAGAALVFAAPAFAVIPASDGSGGSDRLHPAIVAQLELESNVSTYRDAHERGSATNLSQSAVTGYRDANERGSGLTGLGEVATTSTAVATYKDAFERSVIQNQTLASKSSAVGNYKDAFERSVIQNQTLASKSSAVSNYKDAFERSAPPQGTVQVSATSSGTEIEWPQVGAGLGIGILLALGLGLIMRAVHVRPFAH